MLCAGSETTRCTAPSRHSKSLVGRLLFLADVSFPQKKQGTSNLTGDTGDTGRGPAPQRPRGGAASGQCRQCRRAKVHRRASSRTGTSQANHTLLESRQARFAPTKKNAGLDCDKPPDCFGSGCGSGVRWCAGSSMDTADAEGMDGTNGTHGVDEADRDGQGEMRWDGTHPVHIFDTRRNPRCVAALLTALAARCGNVSGTAGQRGPLLAAPPPSPVAVTHAPCSMLGPGTATVGPSKEEKDRVSHFPRRSSAAPQLLGFQSRPSELPGRQLLFFPERADRSDHRATRRRNNKLRSANND